MLLGICMVEAGCADAPSGARTQPGVAWVATIDSATYSEAPLPTEVWKGIGAMPDGGLVATGTFGDAALLTGATEPMVSEGRLDLAVARYSSTGELLWGRRFGGPEADNALANCSDAAGNTFVTGYVTGEVGFDGLVLPAAAIPDNGAEPAPQGFVARLDPDGHVRWVSSAGRLESGSTFPSQELVTLPIPAFTSECDLTADGDVVVTGLFGGNATTVVVVDPAEPWTVVSAFDGFVARYDGATGALEWARRTYGETPGARNRMRALVAMTDGSGDLVVGGRFEGTMRIGDHTLEAHGTRDGFVARLRADGTWLWSRSLGGPGADEVRGFATRDGMLFVGGKYSSSLDVDGHELRSAGGVDLFVAALDAGGHGRWAVGIGGPGNDEGTELAFTGDGTLVAGGSFVEHVEIAGRTIESRGALDALIAGLSTSGDVRWALAPAGGAGVDGIYQMAGGEGARCYAAGVFSGEAQFGDMPVRAAGGDAGMIVAVGDPQR